MTHIAITDEIIQAAIGVETAATKTTRGGFNALIFLLYLVSSILISSLGGGKSFRLLIVFFLQKGTMSVDSGGNVFNNIAGGLDGVMSNLIGDLKARLKMT